MNTSELYSLWLEKAVDDPDLIAELKGIEGNDDEIYDLNSALPDFEELSAREPTE